jgi:hypothetical protein
MAVAADKRVLFVSVHAALGDAVKRAAHREMTSMSAYVRLKFEGVEPAKTGARP